MALLAGFAAIFGQAVFEGLAELADPADTGAQYRRRRLHVRQSHDFRDDSRRWSLENDGDTTTSSSPSSLARAAVLDYRQRTTAGEGTNGPSAGAQWSSGERMSDDASRRSLAREAVLDYRRRTGGTSPFAF